MSLQIENYPDPTSVTPISAAYAWINSLTLDFRANSGQGAGSIMVGVNRSAADAAALLPAVVGVPVQLGQTLVPANGDTPAVVFPTFAELLADPEFAAAFSTVRAKLYTALLAVPAFASAIQVP